MTWILVLLIGCLWCLIATDYFQGKRLDALSKRVDRLDGVDVGGEKL